MSSPPNPGVSGIELSYLNGRVLAKQLGVAPTVLRRKLLLDGMEVVDLGPRSWRIREDHFVHWKTQTANRATDEIGVQERKADFIRRAGSGSKYPAHLR